MEDEKAGRSPPTEICMLQAVVFGNPEKILATLGRQAQTRFPPFVFQKGTLRASEKTQREDFFSKTCEQIARCGQVLRLKGRECR